MNSYMRKHFDSLGVFISVICQAVILSVPAVCLAINKWGTDLFVVIALPVLIGGAVKFLGDLCLRKCAGLAEIAYFAMVYLFCYIPNADNYDQWMFTAFYISAVLEIAVVILNTILPRDEDIDISSSTAATIVLIAGIICCCMCYDLGVSNGFNAGYDFGYDKGYEAGESDGYSDGYEEGYDAGYAEGEDYGYDRGYDSGYDTGSALGSRSDESNYLAPSTSVSGSYIGNVNTGKFHRSSCGYLPYPENQVSFDSREDAIYAGYDPCQRCNP